MNDISSRRSLKLWQFPIVVLLCALLLVVVPLWIIFHLLKGVCLRIVIWYSWCSRGKDILFVYSDSPIWYDYIERCILPYLDERAVILNWSQRRTWHYSLSKTAFRHFGGDREFNPIAIVFRPLGRTHVFRFWQPFHDSKHGDSEALQKMEVDFFQLLGINRIVGDGNPFKNSSLLP